MINKEEQLEKLNIEIAQFAQNIKLGDIEHGSLSLPSLEIAAEHSAIKRGIELYFLLRAERGEEMWIGIYAEKG